MADAFDREQKIAEVMIAEAPPRSVRGQVRQRRRIDEQRDRHLAVVLADKQLLARPPHRRKDFARRLVDHEIVDRDAGIDSVQRLEPTLYAGKRLHYWI